MKTKPFTFTEGKERLQIRLRCNHIIRDLMDLRKQKISIKELREILERNEAQTSFRTVMRWIKKGFFESRKQGRTRLIDKKSLVSFIEKKREERDFELKMKQMRKEERKRWRRRMNRPVNRHEDRLNLIGIE